MSRVQTDTIAVEPSEFCIDQSRDTFVVPDALREADCWITYELVDSSKIPRAPKQRDAHKIDPTDTANCADFESAMNAVVSSKQGSSTVELGGVGISLDAVPELCLIDFDDCVDADGRIDEDVLQSVDEAASYAELSPSGDGIHVLVFDRDGVLDSFKKNGAVEVYDSNRFSTFTGRHLTFSHDGIVRNHGVVSDIQSSWNDETTSARSSISPYSRSVGSAKSSSSSSESGSSSRSSPEVAVQFSELLPDGGHASLRDVEFDDLRLSTRKNIENMCTYNDDAKLLFEDGHEAAREHVKQLSEAERAASGWTDRAGAYDPSSADASLIRQLIFWGKEAGMINSETNDDEIVKAFYASALGDRDKVTARSDYVIRTVGKFLEIDPQ